MFTYGSLMQSPLPPPQNKINAFKNVKKNKKMSSVLFSRGSNYGFKATTRYKPFFVINGNSIDFMCDVDIAQTVPKGSPPSTQVA